MSTMPGLPTRPCFYDIDLDPVTEEITGLFWACSPTLFSWVSSHLYHINASEEAAIVSLYIFHKQLLTVQFVTSTGCWDFAASPGSEALQTSLFLFFVPRLPALFSGAWAPCIHHKAHLNLSHWQETISFSSQLIRIKATWKKRED